MASMSLKVFFSIIFFSGAVVAIDDLKDEADRGASDRGALWFGPRLGKRSLQLANEDNRQTYLRLLEAADALKFYYDQLPFYESQADNPETRVTKKVIFTPKLGRNVDNLEDRGVENLDFTPRLGRRIPLDALPVTPSDDDVYNYKHNQGQVYRRTSYFSPRLGRKLNLTPRLGRELTYNIYPEKIRLARSTNDSKTT